MAILEQVENSERRASRDDAEGVCGGERSFVYVIGTFDGPVWPVGEEWPVGLLPPPCLTIEIAAVELEVLIEHHDDFGAKMATAHEHETELFHAARASYLRQRLAKIAPHRLPPDWKGHA